MNPERNSGDVFDLFDQLKGSELLAGTDMNEDMLNEVMEVEESTIELQCNQCGILMLEDQAIANQSRCVNCDSTRLQTT